MRSVKIITIAAAMFLAAAPSCLSVTRWVRFIDAGRAVSALASAPDMRPCIFAASGRYVLGIEPVSRSVRKIFTVPGEGNTVNGISAVPGDGVYAATSTGIYRSSEDGSVWKKVYKKAGFSGGVTDIAFDPGGGRVYVLTDSSLYCSSDGGVIWSRLYTASAGLAGEDSTGDENAGRNGLKSLAVSACGEVYMIENDRIMKSTDAGQSWERLNVSGIEGARISDFIVVKNGRTVYLATDKGVFRVRTGPGNAENIYMGLGSYAINALVFLRGSPDTVLCSSGDEIFRSSDADSVVYGTPLLMGEPGIREVQEMAVDYAEVSPEKIRRWRRGAGMKAILPKVTFGFDRSSRDTYEIYTSMNTSYAVSGPKNCSDGWDITLSWDLSDLVYNEAQTSIDVRSKLMAELREDILNDVTRLYFERKRLLAEMGRMLPSDSIDMTEKIIRIEELTAQIDALTGGGFSDAFAEGGKSMID